ncbi:MAG: hypothetical protein AAF551_02130 [Bacteroidota bacterium]
MIKNMVFPLFVSAVGILTIYLFPNDHLMVSNACIGILSLLLLFFKTSFYKVSLFLWIVLQLFIVRLDESIPINEGLIGLSEINFSQTLSYFHESLQINISGVGIHFNLIAVFYLVMYFLIVHSSKMASEDRKPNWSTREYANQTYELKLFRVNKTMENILPQKVKVVKQVNFSESKNWLLVSLTKPIRFKNGNVIHRALIKPKDRTPLKRNVKGQMAHFRIVNPKDLKAGKLALKKTKFVDWVFVK